MKTTYTLFRVKIGIATYFSTNISEIINFSLAFGVFGESEIHDNVPYQINGIVAQHPEGTFNKIKRQYFN